MNEATKMVTALFLGKGGTIRFAIAVSVAAATVYEMMQAGYGLKVKNKENRLSFLPGAKADKQEEEQEEDLAPRSEEI